MDFKSFMREMDELKELAKEKREVHDRLTEIEDELRTQKETLLEELEIVANIDRHDIKVMKNHMNLLTEDEQDELTLEQVEREKEVKKFQQDENWEKLEQYIKRIFNHR